MKALIGAMIVALTAGVAFAQVDYLPLPKPKPAPKTGISKKDFDQIKTGLEQNAAALVDGTIPDHESLVALRDLQYDKATWEMVKAYLDSLPKLNLPKGSAANAPKMQDFHRLFIICRLTEPLLCSKPDVILESLKTVQPLESKYCKAYLRFPPCSFLGACKMPTPVKGAPPQAEAFMKVDQNRQKKSTQEQPAILTNQSIGELEGIFCRLMAYAGDTGKDKELFDWIVKNESKDKNYVWKMGTEAFISEAASGDMSKERAAKLYDLFLQFGKRRFGPKDIQWPLNARYKDTKDRELTEEWAYRWYFVRYLPEPSLDEISPDFTVKWDYPSYMLLTTAKYMDMVVKGIKESNNKTLLVVHNPSKADSDKAKPEDRKFKDDPEKWIRENTLHEKPYSDAKEFKEQ